MDYVCATYTVAGEAYSLGPMRGAGGRAAHHPPSPPPSLGAAAPGKAAARWTSPRWRGPSPPSAACRTPCWPPWSARCWSLGGWSSSGCRSCRGWRMRSAARRPAVARGPCREGPCKGKCKSCMGVQVCSVPGRSMLSTYFAHILYISHVSCFMFDISCLRASLFCMFWGFPGVSQYIFVHILLHVFLSFSTICVPFRPQQATDFSVYVQKKYVLFIRKKKNCDVLI